MIRLKWRHRYVSGCVQIINERHNNGGSDTGALRQDRLVPRTEDLPIYSVAEMNDKVQYV